MSLKRIEIEVLDEGYLVTAVLWGAWAYERSRKVAVSTEESVVELVGELLTKNDKAKSKAT